MAVPASQFGGEALLALVQDRRDTMAARDGADLAAAPIAETVLVNPEVTPLNPELEAGEEGCLSVPGCGLRCLAGGGCAKPPSPPPVNPWSGRWRVSMPGSCSTNAII